MAGIWQIFGRGASSPTISEYLHLSKTNIQTISYLTSRESQPEEPLNPNQCRSISFKLVRTLESIAALCYFCDIDGSSATSNTSSISTMAVQNFYLVSERAKELVESCCSVDWCQASTFQIHNEEAFKEILLETSLCYSTIYELVKDKVPFQDLRSTFIFRPPTSAEVVRDRMALLQRYQKLVDTSSNSDSTENQKQHLAKHLMRRLSSFMSQFNIKDFDARDLSLWPDGKSTGDEWGTDSTFLGGSVCKTTWLDVPCAKKVFNDGVPEEAILAEAKILAHLNHPNIVKFICWGHDTENTWCHFIAMEHMEKGLHSVIRKQAQLNNGPPFPLLSAVDIMLQIAYGTCYLHDNGVAHRDLKTCNVVVRQITTPHLRDYYQVKLVDFGLSKVKLSASMSNTISRPKTGTTVYMAPEAFQRGRANWFKADVYSFGITCSVILSGEEPFSREEFARSKMYEAICNGERPVLPADTPEELACLIKECWDTDRNVRPDFVDICTRLAKLRHKLLRVDPHGHASTDGDSTASLYMQGIFKTRSEARKQMLENMIEKVIIERFLPNVPGDLIGLKRQLVQLLNQNGGKMMLTKVPAEYNKLFGRPLYLAEYNAQRLVHLINKMKDTLVIRGDGMLKTLHLAKKEVGLVTNKYKPSSNWASVPKGNKDNEDSEPEGTVPPSKVQEKETAKFDFAADIMRHLLKEDDIKVEDLMGDVYRTNLANFKHHLQELLVSYSNHFPLENFSKAYLQRFAHSLDLPSLGVVSLEALFDKVKDVAVIKEKLEKNGVKSFYLMAV